LGQQQDVMDAVQRMRQRAQEAGKLASTPQENVVTTSDGGQPAIEIMPANPDVIYVPVYDPAWVWGPPLWYPYPRWYYPPRSVIVGGLGFGFGGGINVGLFFGGGWGGWGAWGWHPGWGNRTVIVNNTFINRYNFNTRGLRDAHGTTVWAHDSFHRQGVPYANNNLRDQYRGNVRQNVAPRNGPDFNRGGAAQPAERFGNRQVPANPPQAQGRSAFGGMQNSGEAARAHADHGYSSLGPARSSPGPRAAPSGRSAPASRGGGESRGGGRR
jgi:hypothetical protein